MNKGLSVLVSVFLFMAFVCNASAMMGGMGKGMEMKGSGKMGSMGKGMMSHGQHGHFFRMVEMLELSDDQRKEIQGIHFLHKKEAIRKKADIDVAEVELREITSQPPVDLQAAEKKIRQTAELRADLEFMHLKTHEEIKGKLTPEQLEKLQTHMRQAMEHGKSKMGCGMMMGKGGEKEAEDDSEDQEEKGSASAHNH